MLAGGPPLGSDRRHGGAEERAEGASIDARAQGGGTLEIGGRRRAAAAAFAARTHPEPDHGRGAGPRRRTTAPEPDHGAGAGPRSRSRSRTTAPESAPEPESEPE